MAVINPGYFQVSQKHRIARTSLRVNYIKGKRKIYRKKKYFLLQGRISDVRKKASKGQVIITLVRSVCIVYQCLRHVALATGKRKIVYQTDFCLIQCGNFCIAKIDFVETIAFLV